MISSDFESLALRIAKELEQRSALKEKLNKRSRAVRKRAKQLIQQIHKGKRIEKSLLELEADTRELVTLLEQNPELYHSREVKSAMEEFSECFILNSLIKNGKLPEPEELKLPFKQFILGLGDVVGELRRLVLACLLKQEIEEAHKHLVLMEKIYHALMVFEEPSIRRKQDIARNLIEKTMGELVLLSGAAVLNNSSK